MAIWLIPPALYPLMACSNDGAVASFSGETARGSASSDFMKSATSARGAVEREVVHLQRDGQGDPPSG